MSAAQKLVNVAVCLACIFVLTVDASLSSVYSSCLTPCHPACKDTGKSVFECWRECENGCVDKAYNESKLKDEGKPSKQVIDEEKELWAFKKKHLEELMDTHCKDKKNKQCKDDDKQCTADDYFCKDMYELLKEENRPDEEKTT
ncbi:PREDICTED: uncharacterized protein LOC109191278 [Ipomoea nil]|uniref:uncharacterized protein LOC109191278 n=1 Tax=Ipomoea nil TaxID=35883 RepID=UPI0009019710|nr:PREDICTED: uncharacterized protein LOC109191278 [Ipomoea nil]